jgi:hypothetical protein
LHSAEDKTHNLFINHFILPLITSLVSESRKKTFEQTRFIIVSKQNWMLLLAQNKRAAKLSGPFSQTAMQIHFTHLPTHSLAGKNRSLQRRPCSDTIYAAPHNTGVLPVA